MTAVGADGAGFPDLCMVRGDEILFAELKVGYNKLSEKQVGWGRAITETATPVYAWWPQDWPEIERVLA